jgi:hypothetical protein
MSMTDTEMSKLADMAAERAVAKMTDAAYRELGRRTAHGLLWAIGVIVTAALIWGINRGWIKL